MSDFQCIEGQHFWSPTRETGDTCNCGAFYMFTNSVVTWIEETPDRIEPSDEEIYQAEKHEADK